MSNMILNESKTFIRSEYKVQISYFFWKRQNIWNYPTTYILSESKWLQRFTYHSTGTSYNFWIFFSKMHRVILYRTDVEEISLVYYSMVTNNEALSDSEMFHYRERHKIPFFFSWFDNTNKLQSFR